RCGRESGPRGSFLQAKHAFGRASPGKAAADRTFPRSPRRKRLSHRGSVASPSSDALKNRADQRAAGGSGGFSTVFSTGVENFGERPNAHEVAGTYKSPIKWEAAASNKPSRSFNTS